MEASELDSVIDLIGSAGRIVVVTHARPDGDAIGSGVGLQRALVAAGRSVDFVLLTPWPAKYAFLLAERPPIRFWEQPANLADYDRVVILDTCSYAQLEPVAGQLDGVRDRTAVLDHHATRDPIGAARWIDVTAPACAAMVHRLIERAGWPMDAAVAEALFVGLTTDTGWFRFANTTPGGLRLAADLIERMGRPIEQVYQQVYQNESPQRLALSCLMLKTLELHADGRLAVMHLTQEMYRQTGMDPADSEGLIDLPQVVGSVVVTALLVERPPRAGGGVRVGLRSKRDVDVARIAQSFGGGGHVRAAGAKVADETLESLTPKLIAACEAALAAEGSSSS